MISPNPVRVVDAWGNEARPITSMSETVRPECEARHFGWSRVIAATRKPRQDRGFFMRGHFSMRLLATHYVRLLRRFLRRLAHTPHRHREVLVGRHQVVPHGHRRCVPEPACHDLDRIDFDEFRFPARPEVVEKPRPRLQAGATDDLLECGSKVGVDPARRPHRRLAEPRVDHPRLRKTMLFLRTPPGVREGRSLS